MFGEFHRTEKKKGEERKTWKEDIERKIQKKTSNERSHSRSCRVGSIQEKGW